MNVERTRLQVVCARKLQNGSSRREHSGLGWTTHGLRNAAVDRVRMGGNKNMNASLWRLESELLPLLRRQAVHKLPCPPQPF